jgi:FAD dependent monooxygenase
MTVMQLIYPGVARIFDQFGILKTIQNATTPLQRQYQRWPDGSVLLHGKNMATLAKKFDMPLIIFDRQKCVTHLYEGLPDKSKIRTSARVDRIEHTETGVKVYLDDGTFEEGDIVIGADGVHSRVRQLMWDYAAESAPGTIPETDKSALFTDFKAIFGVCDQGDLDLGPADMHVCMGHGTTKLVFTQPGVAYFAVMWKDDHSRPPTPFRPTQEEQEEIADRFKDLKLVDNITFGDLYKNKTRSGVLNLEEGILSKWHSGRIVLVGDSAHKMTADLGVGANMAIESAVVLCNLLQQAVAQDPNRHLTVPELSSLFSKYQAKRFGRAKAFVDISGKVTRMNSYETLWQRFLVTRIASLEFMRQKSAQNFIWTLAKTPKLEYVGTRTINEDAEGWKLPERKPDTGRPWVAYALVTSAMGVALSYAAMLKWGLPVLS